MAHSQNLSNASNKTRYSLFKSKQLKLEKNARSQLKYIHNRILDHIKMKHFLENHQIDRFLNIIKKCISNVDEIEAFRKKVKCMLLTIKDSIMEFEEAVSSGAITFSSTHKSENCNIAIKKTSQSSSGVSTFGEISSLSSLALTNSNFKTPQYYPSRLDSGPKKSVNRNIIPQNDKDYMPQNSNSVLSSIEMPKSFHYAERNTYLGDNFPNNENTHNSHYEKNLKSLELNRLTQLNTRDIWTPTENDNIISTNTDITLSSLELTNNHFHTLTNNNAITSHIPCKSLTNSMANSGIEEVTQDLFTQPCVSLEKTFENAIHQKCNNMNNNGKLLANIPSKTIIQTSSHNIQKIDMNNHDYIRSLKKLSLGASEINIDQSTTSSQVHERNRECSGEVEIIIEPTLNCTEKQNISEELALINSSSESSEIFLRNSLRLCSVANKCDVIESKSNVNEQSNSQKFVISTKKQYTKDSTKPNEISKLCNSKLPQQVDHKQKIQEVTEKDSMTQRNGYYSPDSFSHIIQSQHIGPLFQDYFNSNNSRGFKRRCTDISSNLEIINGKIISATVDACNSIQSHLVASTEVSHTNVTSICCNKNIYDLDKELEQAKEECSKTLNDLNILFKDSIKYKNNSILGNCNAKLKFPPGYEHHYKHLDDLLYEYKVNIGIPSNIQQYCSAIDQDLFYEEAMRNWKELQQIVQKIKEREKKSRESNKFEN